MSTIVFASRKEIVRALAKELKAAGIKVEAFHSDLEQREREEILLQFKNRQLPVIIGTDALSRGIDVEGIDLVVNFDVPGDAEDYIHRIGRTARAETTGTAITFVNHRDERRLKSIEELMERKIPEHPIPEHLLSIAEVKTSHEAKPNRGNNSRRKPFKGNRKPSGNKS